MSEFPDFLGRIAEKSSGAVSPLAGVIAFYWLYANLDPNRAQFELLSWAFAIAMCASTLCFITKMFLNWPKIPVIDDP